MSTVAPAPSVKLQHGMQFSCIAVQVCVCQQLAPEHLASALVSCLIKHLACRDVSRLSCEQAVMGGRRAAHLGLTEGPAPWHSELLSVAAFLGKLLPARLALGLVWHKLLKAPRRQCLLQKQAPVCRHTVRPMVAGRQV